MIVITIEPYSSYSLNSTSFRVSSPFRGKNNIFRLAKYHHIVNVKLIDAKNSKLFKNHFISVQKLQSVEYMNYILLRYR